jgi:hypothetical protein
MSCSLEVIVKTCDVKNLHFPSQERYCGTDKLTLIKKCLTSIVVACNNRPQKTYITVIDDNSTEACIKSIETILSKSFNKTQLIRRSKNDYNEATLQYFEQARNSTRTLVYCVEDDYLHHPYSINEMCWFYDHAFKQLQQKEIVLYPFDDPDNYYFRYMESARNRHWRTNTHTTCTFLTNPNLIRNNWEHFEKFALNYNKDKNEEIDENNTINRVWAQKNVQLFTPLPSLALHVQFEEQIDKMSNWQELWNMIPDIT